jgi:hypothetical protein
MNQFADFANRQAQSAATPPSLTVLSSYIGNKQKRKRSGETGKPMAITATTLHTSKVTQSPMNKFSDRSPINNLPVTSGWLPTYRASQIKIS